MSDPKDYKSHPSYGMVRFSRVTGSPGKLYGSPLPDHRTYITLEVVQSEYEHHLGQNWYHSSGKVLMEIALSAAQFAELLTNMNTEGVPCTIETVDGRQIERTPQDELVEHEEVVNYFKESNKETVETLRQKLKELKAVLDKKTLSKEDKRQIEWIVGKALQDVESNMPFAVEQFGEAAQKMVTSAKAEVAAATQAIINNLGLQQLASQIEEAKKTGIPLEIQAMMKPKED